MTHAPSSHIGGREGGGGGSERELLASTKQQGNSIGATLNEIVPDSVVPKPSR